MANLYVRAAPTTDLNRNTEWFTYPGVWSTYILILFFSWLMVLSVFACSPGMAWTVVHLSHFLVCLLPPHAYLVIPCSPDMKRKGDNQGKPLIVYQRRKKREDRD
ncbi:hypothetical protein SASPL_133002 [Salvia splendens]|uniref:ORM1-like protein 3 n=1 Tax=Salvia splendens TaxID=180675 RepID=A0A8X8X279_SALSN|nr:hypothetical protein SASPL_133002 [Salvia splendens]